MTNAMWIILTGVLVAGSAGFIGSFLILRRMAMLGDAISHAILPGVVLAFLFAQNMETMTMIIGASLFGLLTTFLIQLFKNVGVKSDAAIGVTFTALFATGVVLVSYYADEVHLDLQHVLYGEIAYVPWDMVTLMGIEMPQAVWTMGIVFLITLIVVGLFYKEFKLSSFDPQMAAAIGMPVIFLHYLLMSLVSLNTVAAFDSVGSILVVAMIVVPGATAYLLTDRLLVMLGISIAVGAASAIFGYIVAAAFNASISGSMATVSGVLFTLAFLFSPQYGLVARKLAQRKMEKQHA